MNATSSVTIRRACERGVTRIDWLTSYHTFSFGDYVDPAFHQFGVLRVINDDTVQPGKGFAPHSHRDMEIITYVLSGALAHQDSLGNGATITAGEVQRMSAGTGIQHSEYNASQTEPVHFLQIWLFPNQKGLTPSYEQQPAVNPALRNVWQSIVSPSVDEPGLTVHQDVRLWVLQADEGFVSDYPPQQPGRAIWGHVVAGGFQLGEWTLSPGDGFGLTRTQAASLTSLAADSQILLFDLPPVSN